MEKKVLVDKLAGLPALYRKASDLFTYNRAQQVALGLITADEYKALTGADAVKGEADAARHAAEEAIGWGAEEVSARLPQEYQVAVNRHNGLKGYIKQEKAIRDTLYTLAGRSLYAPTPIRGSIGLDDLAEKVFTTFKDTTDPLSTEYHGLEDVIARKERVGTKVQKIRVAHYDRIRAERKVAGDAAHAAIINKHPALLQKELQIERAIAKRREEQLTPIRRDIEALLKAALKERR